MKRQYLTEAEQANQNQQYAYQVLRISQTDKAKFTEIANYLPFIIHGITLDSSQYTYHNNQLELLLGDETVHRLEQDTTYMLSCLLDQRVHSRNMATWKRHQLRNDSDSVFSYYQRLKIGGEYEWFMSYKSLFTQSSNIVLNTRVKLLGQTGKLLRDILGETCVNRNGWQLFKTLTRREKEVMQLLAQGMTSREISDQLSISKFTVDTHRKRLFSKLEVKNYAQLFKVTQGFQLLDLEGKPYC